MNNNIQWQQITVKDPSPDGYATSIIESAVYSKEMGLTEQVFFEQAIDKAIDLLPHNLLDNGRYLLFTWSEELARLEITATDDAKLIDSPASVRIDMPHWLEGAGLEGAGLEASGLEDSNVDTVQFWLKDYLTVCDRFFNFSLIAVFCLGDRSKTVLL